MSEMMAVLPLSITGKVAERPFALGLRVTAYNWRMRKAREAKALTQQALADMVGVSVAVVQNIELLRSEYRPEWEVLDRIASVLEQDTTVVFPQWLRAKAVKELVTADLPLAVMEEAVSGTDDLLRGVLATQLKERITDMLETLPARERIVLQLRFGLNDRQSLTLRDLARKVDLSTARVRQIEARALRRLRGRLPRGRLSLESELVDRPLWAECSSSEVKCKTPISVGFHKWGVCPVCSVEMRLEDGFFPKHDRKRDAHESP